MEIDLSLFISLVSLLVAIIVGIVQILNWKSNRTRLKIAQIMYNPNPIGNRNYINHLVLDGDQDSSIREIVPIFYLFIYIKIENLSFQPITISNFTLNRKAKFDKKSYF
ncbi:hypothetical protein CHI12_16680, partial [Terribacillus saccharophilus]